MKLSADGLFYWDGQRWVSALSPDGRFRWDGTSWVPVAVYGPHYYPPAMGPLPRVPSSWTRPLQYAVTGYYVASGMWALSLPFWVAGSVTQAFTQAFQQQQQANPNATPPPAELVSTMSNLLSGFVWLNTLFIVAVAVVAIIGALNRWTWVYWVVLVLAGIGAVYLPFEILGLFGTMSLGAANASPLTAVNLPVTLANILFGLGDAGLFAVMLFAIIKRGPWGMPRQTWSPPAS